jgi:hypothetical protein
MRFQDKVNLLTLRVCVGYLGELHQLNWWTSSFYSENSNAFLIHVFGKTSLKAQYYGVRDAAAIVHDEVIGIGEGVFHLFRLPESLERDFHDLLAQPKVVDIIKNQTTSKETAWEYLESVSKGSNENSIGPIRIGNISDIDSPATWSKASMYYYQAFLNGNKSFPYIMEEKN